MRVSGLALSYIPSAKGRWSIDRFEEFHHPFTIRDVVRGYITPSLWRSHWAPVSVSELSLVLPRLRVVNCMLTTLGRGFFLGHSDF